MHDFLSINALILSDGNAISKYITEKHVIKVFKLLYVKAGIVELKPNFNFTKYLEHSMTRKIKSIIFEQFLSNAISFSNPYSFRIPANK